jgi:hypothetical protein
VNRRTAREEDVHQDKVEEYADEVFTKLEVAHIYFCEQGMMPGIKKCSRMLLGKRN